MNRISLHIGLNAVDPVHYAGWNGNLTACENDAKDLAALATSCGFTATTLLTANATSKAVLASIEEAAISLKNGDFFLLSFAGHGSQVPDRNGSDEDDGLDETWLLFDRMLIDDEIFSALAKFRSGVRIVAISDSCHSGTVLRNRAYQELALTSAGEAKLRVVPPDIAQLIYQNHRELYDSLQQKNIVSRDITADMILLSACQDTQVAADGIRNGLFTDTLLRTWEMGRFKGTYRSFLQAIARKMPPTQVPNILALGPHSEKFVLEQPFSIEQTPPFEPYQPIKPSEENMNINGTWEEVLAELTKRIQNSGESEALDRLITANSQAAQAGFFGLPGSSNVATTSTLQTSVRGGTVVRAFVWGFHIEISHEDLEALIGSFDPINTFTNNMSSNVPDSVSPWIRIAAAFISGALQLLRSLDRGRGVYISMSWFVPGVFVPTSVL